MNNQKIFEEIQNIIDRSDGNSDRFAETLRREMIPHLSFSQISTVEFCENRYLMQYVKMRDPDPVPDYFTKGKLFHEIVASFYKQKNDGMHDVKNEAFKMIANHYQGQNQFHLENAFLVHLENCWKDCEVVAIEKPFVMVIDPDLPPCVGVVDLILKRDGKFILVDHKTGRNFYPLDGLQMAIYVEFMRRLSGNTECEFYYDEYRWIKNLGRIRKPAFQRIGVALETNSWQAALTRIKNGFTIIDRINTQRNAEHNGECFRCPYRNECW